MALRVGLSIAKLRAENRELPQGSESLWAQAGAWLVEGAPVTECLRARGREEGCYLVCFGVPMGRCVEVW